MLSYSAHQGTEQLLFGLRDVWRIVEDQIRQAKLFSMGKLLIQTVQLKRCHLTFDFAKRSFKFGIIQARQISPPGTICPSVTSTSESMPPSRLWIT